MNPRYRPFLLGAIALAAVWLVAIGGSCWARSSKPTAERVSEHVRTVRFEELTGDARAVALARLAELLNALSADERRKARMQGIWRPWFEQMTDEERLRFIEATAPSGFRQMLTAFEKLPEDRRTAAIGDALQRLRASGDGAGVVFEGASDGSATGAPSWALSEELRDRVTRIGLKAYYSGSSARTKAELAPLMEELQATMENGGMRKGWPRRGRSEP
ncbi:MAG: hypothetical protein AB7O66_14910 [Limisphaerales bacterium]